jgi:4-hydroxybenzoate polyprenyltransferase
MVGNLLRLARLEHWIKNAFVVVPVPFALAAGASVDVPRFLLGLLGFSLVTSSVYVVNDIRDAAADRHNPLKRQRPVAARTISPAVAWAFAGLLAVTGFVALQLTGHRLALLLTLVYLAANVAYSYRLKHVALVDVFLLASGYVIRVLLGCALIDAAPSNWLLICASALALFLAFTKRRADLVAGVSLEHRPVLAGYSPAFLEHAMTIMCGVALLAYALYSIEAAGFRERRELAGMPFVAFALLQYLRMAFTEARGASPVEMTLRSTQLQVCALAWLLATIWSLGLI